MGVNWKKSAARSFLAMQPQLCHFDKTLKRANPNGATHGATHHFCTLSKSVFEHREVSKHQTTKTN